MYYGGILEVGSDCARLDTGVELKLFDNIVFEAGGKVFCKILEKQEETYLLQYTSIPSGYTLWYQNALGITQDHDPQRNHVKGGK